GRRATSSMPVAREVGIDARRCLLHVHHKISSEARSLATGKAYAWLRMTRQEVQHEESTAGPHHLRRRELPSGARRLLVVVASRQVIQSALIDLDPIRDLVLRAGILAHLTPSLTGGKHQQ
ncbi:hypothetical protein ABZX92_45375, partial [Lentzea sp. NPDC006480]|uniref:hypothetical protein n=1 Tax=Lentzea sp. NPDC006480 TaxID=3157176 RepID=UPI0033BDDD50